MVQKNIGIGKKEKDKILYDINQGILNKQKDSGMAKIANARYETIQKYGK